MDLGIDCGYDLSDDAIKFAWTFLTDILKISVANRFKSLLTGKGIVIVNSIISLILVISGVVLIIKGL